jgi:hypothetical protein
MIKRNVKSQWRYQFKSKINIFQISFIINKIYNEFYFLNKINSHNKLDAYFTVTTTRVVSRLTRVTRDPRSPRCAPPQAHQDQISGVTTLLIPSSHTHLFAFACWNPLSPTKFTKPVWPKTKKIDQFLFKTKNFQNL